MIESNLSLDDECQLYHEAFYHSVHPPVAPIIHCPSKPTYHSRLICDRCGSSGHFSSNCSVPLPSIAELEAIHQIDVDECLALAPATHSRDEFGFFQKDAGNFDPISSTVEKDGETLPLNWTTDHFCLNCGRPGHHFSHCPDITFTELLNEMDESVGPQGVPSPEKRWQSLTSISKT
jgi:hypothetical protein